MRTFENEFHADSTQQITLNRNIKSDYAYNEAIKTLRANIQFSGNKVKVIMFTSSLPDEGKSDISFAVAEAFSQIGKKTLVIDADIRKSVLATRYNIHQDLNGLSQYLSGQKEFGEVLYNTDNPNLDVIFSGPYSPNPAELLEEELFESLVRSMRNTYDYVIIDTPPMANLIDGAVVAKHCDGAVIVIESGAVSYKLVQKVKAQIETTGCRILGAVLNKVDMYANGYYGKYGKYGKYGSYGYGYGYGYGHESREDCTSNTPKEAGS